MGSPGFPLPVLMHLFYFGVYLPFRTWRSRNVWPTAAARRTRVEHYEANILQFSVHGVMSVVTLLFLLPSERGLLFPLEWPTLWDVLLGVMAGGIIVAIDLTYSRRCFDRDAPHMYAATPQTREERNGWVAQSVAAGVFEELTWRGVQPALVARLVGLWPAVVICVATFGLGHIRQGKPFVLLAALFAAMFQALTWLTGALYVPMLVHVAVDIILGFQAGKWVKRSQ